VKKLNLTEFARSFGLYKPQDSNKPFHKENPAEATQSEEQFGKRLKKAQLKELEKKEKSAPEEKRELFGGRAQRLRREIFVDERRVETRKRTFKKAENVSRRQLSEFM